MLVKDFVAVSCFDYVNIVLDGELVEVYEKFENEFLEYADYKVVAINPIKCSAWLTGIEIEIEKA